MIEQWLYPYLPLYWLGDKTDWEDFLVVCHVSTFLAPLISNSRKNASNNPDEFTLYQISDLYSFILGRKTLFLSKRTGNHGLLCVIRAFLFCTALVLCYKYNWWTWNTAQISGVFKEKSATVSYRPRGWYLFNAKVTPSEGLCLWGELCAQLSRDDGYKRAKAITRDMHRCLLHILILSVSPSATSLCHVKHQSLPPCQLHSLLPGQMAQPLYRKKKKEGETSTRLLCKLTLINHQLN